MRLSLQLYTIREPLAADLEGTLRAVREMGLEYVETAGFYDRSASEFASLLHLNGLKVSGMHVGLDVIQNELEELIQNAKTLGSPFVILPWLNDDQRTDYSALGRRLAEHVKPLRDACIGFAYHNHAFEFDGGQDGLAAMLDAGIDGQFDLGWLAVAGHNPVDYLRAHAGRVPLVHLKDYSGNPESHDAEAGSGTLDFPAILSACQELGVQFGAVEMDHTPGPPLESVRRCVEHFHGLGLK